MTDPSHPSPFARPSCQDYLALAFTDTPNVIWLGVAGQDNRAVFQQDDHPVILGLRKKFAGRGDAFRKPSTD